MASSGATLLTYLLKLPSSLLLRRSLARPAKSCLAPTMASHNPQTGIVSQEAVRPAVPADRQLAFRSVPWGRTNLRQPGRSSQIGAAREGRARRSRGRRGTWTPDDRPLAAAEHQEPPVQQVRLLTVPVVRARPPCALLR